MSDVRAAEPIPDPSSSPTQISDLGTSGDRIRAVVSGLRQSLADNGLSQALTRAGDWVKDLEVSWTAHQGGRASGGINTATDSDSDMDTPAPTATAASKRVAFPSHPASLNLGLVSFGPSNSDDQVGAIGHAQPLASLPTDNAMSEHSGAANGEHA